RFRDCARHPGPRAHLRLAGVGTRQGLTSTSNAEAQRTQSSQRKHEIEIVGSIYYELTWTAPDNSRRAAIDHSHSLSLCDLCGPLAIFASRFSFWLFSAPSAFSAPLR